MQYLNISHIFAQFGFLVVAMALETKSNSIDEYIPVTFPSKLSKEMAMESAQLLNGKTLKIVTIERPPFSSVIRQPNGEIFFDGVVFELLRALVVKYNFSMDIFIVPDGNWGARSKKTGKWNGMIGLVLRKEADIGAASFSITLERSRVIAFTTAFHQEPTAILIPAPTEGEKLTVLIRPLTPPVWLGLGLSIAVIGPTFYALHILHFSVRRNWKTEKAKRKGIIANLWMYITGSLVQESVVCPTERTARILVALWWMVTLVMANTYVAFLVSFLSAPKLKNIVESLEDLTQQSKLRWTFRFGTAHYALFKSDTSVGVFKTIGDGVNDDDLVTTDYQGVEKAITGGWAFIKEKSFLEVALGHDFDSQKKCRLNLATEEFFTVGIGLVTKTQSPYINILDYEIANVISTGLMDKWKQLHWPKNLHCVAAEVYIISTREATRKLDLGDIQGAVFLWVTGLTLGSIIFFLEILTNYSLRRIKAFLEWCNTETTPTFQFTYTK